MYLFIFRSYVGCKKYPYEDFEKLEEFALTHVDMFQTAFPLYIDMTDEFEIYHDYL